MLRFQISLLALVAASPLAAQTNPSLPATDAEGRDVVVTASRSGLGTPAAQLPASVTIIDDAALAQRQTRLVSDVLRDVPGLAVNRSVGGLTDVRIRGSEANQVLVLIDGIEVADPFQGQFDFNTLIADEGARIEVLRGQQSSLYGSDAIGGVINYSTLTGAEAPGLRARAEGGSFGTFAGAARFGGTADTVDYALSTSLYSTDGTPTARGGDRDIGQTNVAASAKLNWTPSPVFKLTGVGRYSHVDARSNNSESDPTSPLFGYIVDTPGSSFKNEGFYGLARAELALLDGRWTSALTGQAASTTRKGYIDAGFDNGNKGRRYKGSFETSLRLGNEQLSHRVTAAVDVEREKFRNTTPSAFVFQGWRHTDNVGLVGQYELTMDDAFTFGASIRHDDNDRFANATTWRTQAGYCFASGTRLRGAYGTGVKNPGYYELYGYSDGIYIGNPDLKPEKSRGWEAGIDQALADGRITFGATYFRNRLHDEIYTTYPAPDFVATPDNRTTTSKQQGVEAFASVRPSEQIRIDLAYTYLDATENGVNEVRRPDHIASANLNWTSADQRFSGTLMVRYNGNQDDVAYTDPSFTPVRVRLDDFVLVNLNAEYRLTEALTLFGRVENLLDEDYEEVFSYRTPGRGAFAGIRARF
ncbi:TonB-dependent receptor plug domain-containing protein [Sphingomonas sp.]|uniref:TonB-dependent receptor plug domain-containing protein n=1 Tax=Sphingomonas sp. TaxID=28214 RepID=UPI003B3BAD21